MRRPLLLILLVPGFLAACASGASLQPRASNADRAAAPPASDQLIELGNDFQLRRLDASIWLHVSFKELPGVGRYPSNGLVVLGPEGALLVDTPWTPEQTRRLLAWLRDTQGTAVREVIITHFHDDRLGGVSELPSSVRIHALTATSELAARQGHRFSATALQPETSLSLVGESVEIYFPGAGHAPDNLVVWLPARRMLFAGCLVKSADSGSLGNLADADVPSWRDSVQRVIERYPNATVVVPGHGDPGGQELLVHTRELVDAAPVPDDVE